jgi:hypothetical protein
LLHQEAIRFTQVQMARVPLYDLDAVGRVAGDEAVAHQAGMTIGPSPWLTVVVLNRI